MMKAYIFALVVTGVATAYVVGCKDDHTDDHAHAADAGHTSPYPACNDILEACHEVDTGEGPIHDCHETGHDAKSEADCTPVKANCVSICKAAAADSGAGEDSGEHAEHDGG